MPSSRASSWKAVERLRVAHVVVLRPSRFPGARRARDPRRRSRGRPTPSAWLRCCRASSCSTNVRVPCSTPAPPPAKRAAWRPGLMASPPASTPISRTPASSTNASKMPMALLPPPTHAMTASGRRPICARHCSRASLPMTRLELAHHQRIRMRAERRAQQVVRVVGTRHPVAHGLVDGVLQRPAAGIHAFARFAPSSRMRNTLSAWRRMSSVPM